MRTAATPWDALLCQSLPSPQPADACTVLAVDGRQLAAAHAVTPEQRKALRRQYMRDYLRAWRQRKRQAAAASTDSTPTPERTEP